MKEIMTRYIIRFKGHTERLLILTMLLLQMSVPLPRYLYWLLSNLPSPLGWDRVSSGYTATFSWAKSLWYHCHLETLVSFLKWGTSSCLQHPPNLSLFSKQGWQILIGLNSHAQSHQSIKVSSQNFLNGNAHVYSVDILLKGRFLFPLRTTVSSKGSVENDSAAGILWPHTIARGSRRRWQSPEVPWIWQMR